MTAALDRLGERLAGLSAQGRAVNVFFRDDDVDVDEESLRRLLATFAERGLPLTLGVIPAGLTDECVSLLKEERCAQGGRVELVQHGWSHTNHEAEGRKCEFGPSRDYAAQLADIERGMARLTEAFGADFFPAFIPPWNRCTADTFRALDALGFRVLSKDSRAPVTGYGFREISTTLDIYTWRGGAALRPEAEILSELAAQLGERETVGVLLHHKVMRDDGWALLADLLDVLRAAPAARLRTLGEMAE
jgi:hypothetical protein